MKKIGIIFSFAFLIFSLFLFSPKITMAQCVPGPNQYCCDNISNTCVDNCNPGFSSQCTWNVGNCTWPLTGTACVAPTSTPAPPPTSTPPPVYSCSEPDQCLMACPADWSDTGDICPIASFRCCRPAYTSGNANVNIYCSGNDPTQLTSEPTGRIATAIGCIPFLSIGGLLRFLYPWALGMGGGIALLLIAYAGFQIATAAGNPQKLQSGKELLWAAIGGLLLIAFSGFILRVIGGDILQIFQ